MRIFIITDLEGVNGVLNFDDWCVPSGLRNETACRFLTTEVNAAVDGFFAGGASEVIIFDGHGSGGSIRGEMLDQRAALQRGGQAFPISNPDVDAVAFVGQHAKAGTANAHLAHTQTEEAVDFRLNGLSIGEFGQFAYAYAERNIPTILAVGDLALTREARELIPEIFTTAVKAGFNAPVTADCPAEKLFAHESAALHYPQQQVLTNIRTQAKLAVEQLLRKPEIFKIQALPPAPGYRIEAQYRATSPRLFSLVGELPPRRIVTAEFATVAEAINDFYSHREWSKADNEYVFDI